MMKKTLLYLLTVTLLSSCADDLQIVTPIPTEQQIEWHKLETYAFIHFGLNTYNDLEWGYGDTPASTFTPTNLDCEQWVATLKKCGMKGVILTAKHHDGFCLWQTKTTDYSIANSPYKNGKGDMVKELSDACRKHGLKFGLYLSPWDRNHAEYGREGYVETYHKQIDELTSSYGELFEFWFDGANGGNGFYGGANETRSINAKEYYDYERARDSILKRHPNAMIFGGTCQTIRWVGNEQGWAGDTDWCMINPEHHQDNHFYLTYGDENGTHWIPAEVDVSIRPGWFYHKREDHQLKSLSQMTDIYYRSVGHNANLLLNFPINLDGKIPAQDSARAVEWYNVISNDLKDNLLKDAKINIDNERGRKFKAENVIDDNWDTYWATEDDYNVGTISFSFDEPVKMNRVVLQEYIPLGQRVKKFYIEGELNGKWFKINPSDTLSTIGYKRIVRFNTVELDKLIIYFEESRGPLCINNIEAYYAPVLLTEPVITRDYDNYVKIETSDKDAAIFYTIDGSAPNKNSLKYDKPFIYNKKGVIKAVVYDIESKNKSAVATKEIDLSHDFFNIIEPNEGSKKMIDANVYSTMYIDNNEPVIIEFKEKQVITGFRYTPNQSRDASRHIVDYEFYVDGKLVKSGAFGNIKNNPIEQVVKFDAVEGKSVRFVPKSNTDNSRNCGIAEFSVITE
ncbi:MAG: alpha-L-fucosidase [Bacteroidales bacterium]|nr:alpha-L-fucosidase [Bacteroidales bacterium]